MASNGGVLASCVFCDFCVSDANYQEHLQVWHKVTVDLEEDARRVLGLPFNMRSVKDEFLGDVGEGPSSSCIATCMQEPVREVGGRRESGEEGDVVNLVEAIREASVEKSRRGNEFKVQVMSSLRQCLAEVRGFQGGAKIKVASGQRCGLEESKARVKKWCDELRERKREKWCEECCVNISASNFKRHRRLMHSREKSAMCPVPECDKNFYHNRYLEDHLRSVHGYDNFLCAVKCPKIEGVQLESGPKVEDCPQERVLGTMKPRFKCDECGLDFAAASLIQHKKAAHRGEKNAKCPEAGCDKRYRYKIQLKDHMRAVHNYEKLECPRCGAKFSSYSGHTDHLARCSGPKPGHLSCMFPNCREKFSSMKQLKLHFEEGHSSNSEFACGVPGCSKTYDGKYRLERHKEKVHAEVKFDAESQEAMHGSLRRKGNHGEKEVMEEDQADDISKEGDTKNESVEDLSEEEDVGAIQKWLEENSCPSKASGTLADPSEGKVEVQEISMEIF